MLMQALIYRLMEIPEFIQTHLFTKWANLIIPAISFVGSIVPHI